MYRLPTSRSSVRACATQPNSHDPRKGIKGMRSFFKDLKERRKEIERKNLDSLASVQQSLKQIIKEELEFVKSLKEDMGPVEADEVIEDTWK